MGIGFLVSAILFGFLLNSYVQKREIETIARENGMIYESECRVLTNSTKSSD